MTVDVLPDVPRGTVLHLGAGEWYAGGEVAVTETTLTVYAVDRAPRLQGGEREFWVSAHRSTCTTPDSHLPCASTYVPLIALLRETGSS